jgi:hypothetical protein
VKLASKDVIALAAAVLLVLCSVFYFAGKSRAVYEHGYYDLPIFTAAAVRYWQGQPLYQRSDNLPELYKPGAIVFKFPPPYLFHFLPWFDSSAVWHDWFRAGITFFFIVLYGLTVSVICHLVLQCRAAKRTGYPDAAAVVFVLLAFAYACAYMPFFVVQGGTSGEGFILALAVLAFACMQRFPWLAGFMLAWLASIKLYPVFLLLYPLLTRQWRVLFSALVSGVLITVASIVVFGLDENLFYLQSVLPVLLSEPVSEDWTEMFRHTTGNQAIVKVLVGYGLLPSRLPVWLNVMRLPFVVAMVLLLLKYSMRHNPQQWRSLLAFGLVVLTMLICLPNIFYAYFVLLLFPALVLAGYLWVQKRWYWLLLLIVCMSCFVIDDSWTHALAQSAAAHNSQAMVEEIQQVGMRSYLWRHQKFLLFLWCQGLATPFMLYALWFFTAFALRKAAFSRPHTPV